MKQSCYGCKFALEARDLPRQGEQVRCAKAEELFGTDLKGGKRWVDVRRSEKTGKLLKPKCGTYEPFTGDDSVTTVEEPEKETVKVSCHYCKGSGKKKVRIGTHSEVWNCHHCNGKGSVEK
jgi:ribosomal protein L37AE/L43A